MSDTPPLEFGFPPIADHNARILILGSMPSIKSLEQQQYYAHPRNAFWPIMAKTFGFEQSSSYESRCQYLINNHIAVWDVLQSCQRQGSLDSDIVLSSMTANDFNHFLKQHPNISQILFNGTKSEQVFNRHALTTLTKRCAHITRQRLPSTSPAHASLNFEQKLALWQQALQIKL